MERIVALGIDPGYGVCGYGVVGLPEIHWGAIKTAPNDPFPKRLVELDEDVTAILKEFQPDVVGIEEDMFLERNTNAATVMQAYGVIRCAIARLSIPELTFSPWDIKEGICHRHATKSEMVEAVKERLGIVQSLKHDDCADGLAAACLAQSRYRLEFLS